MSLKIETKPANGPDEFVTLMDKAGYYVLRYQIPIIIVLALSLILVIGALVIKSQREKDLVADNQALYKASTSANPVEGLQGYLAQSDPSAIDYVAHVQLFQKLKGSENEADRAKAQEQLLLAQVNAPEFLKPVLAFSNAQWLWQQGKPAEALNALEGVKDSELMGGYPRLLQAVILESTGKVAEAEKIYRELAQKKDDPFTSGEARVNLLSLKAQGQI